MIVFMREQLLEFPELNKLVAEGRENLLMPTSVRRVGLAYLGMAAQDLDSLNTAELSRLDTMAFKEEKFLSSLH